MQKQTISVGTQPSVRLDAVDGDLQIAGWERPEISAKTDGDNLNLSQVGDAIRIEADGDVILYVPAGAQISVDAIGRDADLRGLNGPAQIGAIGGDLQARAVNALNIQTVGGDLNLRSANGDCRVETVGGDASVRGVQGNVEFANIGGDMYLREVEGSVSAHVGADAILFIAPHANCEYHIQAGSDALLRLTPDATCQIEAQAGSELHCSLPGYEPDDEDTLQASINLGDGTAQIHIQAGDELVITTRSEQWESMNEFNPDWRDERDFINIPPLPDIRIGDTNLNLNERIQQRLEYANERIRAKMEQSQGRVDAAMRKAEKKMRQAGERQTSRSWHVNIPPMPPAPPSPLQRSEPVSEKERLAILKMLEEKKISIAQAEQLLSALEGK